ncbi:SDR family NAD(P)-dependent oxidoreductase [Novosphingobium sp.]|uniref:SDR family NAD(P)-dependent oxidoreductase n=1 Tax=Novosphingobium sp. TaxID=1874826 RepID=UPI002733BA41|nr:SDR family oxidoreductase [Novosphingobium sp.]MDP3908547.1 SDR family oxidoreductase [Novosphingobium sp.]
MTIARLFGLEAKRALIIGGTPIGHATQALFAEAGATCVLVDPQSDPDAVAGAVDEFAAQHRGIDILVYAATLTGTFPLANLTLEQWDRLHNHNLRGAFVAIRQAVRHMRDHDGGVIVGVSTMGAVHPVLQGNAAYGSSKAGLNALIRAVALDEHANGIRANIIMPGAVPVGDPDADTVRLGGPAMEPGRLMLGMGSCEDVAAGILYLASPASRFMTGQALVLDGGFLIS